MKPVDRDAFAETRRATLKAVGRITSPNAQGFLMDLDHAMDGAGILGLRVKWRADDDCGFTAVGRFTDDADGMARRIVAALDDKVTYGDGRHAVTVNSSSERVDVSFLTWTTDIGLATVCIEVTRATSMAAD